MLVAAATAYGFNAPFARLAARAGVPAAHLVTLRVGIVLVLLAALVPLSGTSLRVPRGERRRLVALGLVTSVVGLGYVSAVTLIPVGVAVLVLYTYPLLILLATPFIDGGRLGARRLAGFGAAFAGIALAIGPSWQLLDWRGLALAAAASVGAATQFFLGSRAPGGGGLTTVFWVHVVILPAALLASAVTGAGALAPLPTAGWPVLLTTLGYLLGFVLQFAGLRRSSAAAAGLIFCLEPIVSTTMAAWLLDEPLSARQVGGGALVLLGIVGTLGQRDEPAPSGVARGKFAAS